MYNADYTVARCLSIYLSHAVILSKWLNISSNFFLPMGSHTVLVFINMVPNVMVVFQWGALMGALNAGLGNKLSCLRETA